MRQIDPLINLAPDPVFAGSGHFRPRDPLQARDHSSLGSLLEGIAFVCRSRLRRVAAWGLGTATLVLSIRWAFA
jgi:hypothetical protein